MDTQTFKDAGMKPYPKLHPVCSSLGGRESDAYWECFTRHMAVNVYHPTSTCKMGPDTDPTAVVDSKLRCVFTGKIQ